MRILIVDDEKNTRDELVELMSAYGDCVTAEDGAEAIDVFQSAFKMNDAFDIVCVDILMPEKDGYQVVHEIRDIEKIMGVSDEYRAKIVVTSQQNEARTLKTAFELGCDVYAGKPINGEKFIAALKKLNILE